MVLWTEPLEVLWVVALWLQFFAPRNSGASISLLTGTQYCWLSRTLWSLYSWSCCVAYHPSWAPLSHSSQFNFCQFENNFRPYQSNMYKFLYIYLYKCKEKETEGVFITCLRFCLYTSLVGIRWRVSPLILSSYFHLINKVTSLPCLLSGCYLPLCYVRR